MERPTRRTNWRIRLSDHLVATGNSGFGWGQNDCLIWTATCVDVQCGTAIANDWINKYSNEREAIALLRKHKFATLADAAASVLGEPISRTAWAIDGDIVWIPRHRSIVPFGRYGCLLVMSGPTALGVSFNGLIGIARSELRGITDAMTFQLGRA